MPNPIIAHPVHFFPILTRQKGMLGIPKGRDNMGIGRILTAWTTIPHTGGLPAMSAGDAEIGQHRLKYC